MGCLYASLKMYVIPAPNTILKYINYPKPADPLFNAMLKTSPKLECYKHAIIIYIIPHVLGS